MPSAVPSTAPITTSDKVLAQLPSVNHPFKSTSTINSEAEAQWLFSDADLAHTPSIRAGMDPKQEYQLRAKGLSFISQTGIMLRLPQITLYTASLLFNRFLMRYSLLTNNKSPRKPGESRPMHVYQIGALALHLSTKVSETPRKVRDIIVCCVRVALHNSNLLVPEDSKDFWRWRDTLLLHEDLMLETLCFDLNVESPHKLLFELLKSLGAEHNKRLRNAAWTFINDAGATTVGLKFPAKVLSGAAVYAAAKHCEYLGEREAAQFKDDAKSGKPWWSAHHLELREIRRCCNAMAELYEAEPVRGGDTPGKEMLTGDVDGVGDAGIYQRLRTPSQGPEDDAPKRLKRKSDPAVKRDHDGTPKPTTNGVSQTTQSSSQQAPEPPSDPQLPVDDLAKDDRDTKKARTQDAGDTAPKDVAKSAKEDMGSEEGELDE